MFEASNETTRCLFHLSRANVILILDRMQFLEFYRGETSTFAKVLMLVVTEARPISSLANIGSSPVIRRIR